MHVLFFFLTHGGRMAVVSSVTFAAMLWRRCVEQYLCGELYLLAHFCQYILKMLVWYLLALDIGL